MINIRLADISDGEEVIKLSREIHDYHREQRPEIFADVSPYSKQFYELMLNDENTNIFVAANEANAIIAYMIITTINYTNMVMLNKRRIVMIDDFCVAKAYKRQGVGTKMFNAAKSFAKEKQVDAIELCVWEFNDEAKEFYKAMGMNVKSRELELEI